MSTSWARFSAFQLAVRLSYAPFRFKYLPIEIASCILALAVMGPWRWKTYRSLVLVSREMQVLAYEACLPHLPILLLSLPHFESFCALLDSQPAAVGPRVRSVWFVASIKAGTERTLGLEILRKCPRINRIACNINLLRAFIASPPTFVHHDLRDLTLIETQIPWRDLLHSDLSSGPQLFGQLTHLRTAGVINFNLTYEFCFTSLTHLSFSCHSPPGRGSSSECVFDSERFPVLKKIVPSVPYMQWRCQKPLTLRIAGRKVDPRMLVIACPKKWKELEIWAEGGPEDRDLWIRAQTTEFLKESRAFTQEISSRIDEDWDDELYGYGSD